MSTHNICFREEIRKILCGYPLLSIAMDISINFSQKTCSGHSLEVHSLEAHSLEVPQ